MSTSLEDFGKELKNKREEKNISIRDMYEKTRIDAKYLEEIEKGNFDFMSDVYIRAFIRKYADSVDIEPDEAMRKYDAAKSGKSIYETHSETKNEEESESLPSKETENSKSSTYSEKNSTQFNPILVLISISVIIIAVLLYFFLFNNGSEEIIIEPKVEEILNEQKAEKQSPRFEVKTNIEADNKNIMKQDSVFLKINATDTVWFRIRIDGKTDDEFIMQPANTKTLIAASKINLLLGNSGGVELILNGKKLQFSGKKGEIRNFSVDSKGIHFSKKLHNINE